MYFRAIQGHSGGNFVYLSLRGNVLLPDHFAENMYHVGNASKCTPSEVTDPRREKPLKGQAVSVLHSR